MYRPLAYNDNSIQYEGGIKFVSLIMDELVANGRRCEYMSLYRHPLERQTGFEWQTKISEDWEEDDRWCLIANVHQVDSQYTSPPFAVELVGDKMLILVRDKDGVHFIYSKPMIKGEWLKFRVGARFTAKNNGFIKVYINGNHEAEYNGPTYFPDTETGPYFKCGIYMSQKSKVVKRTIEHRV